MSQYYARKPLARQRMMVKVLFLLIPFCPFFTIFFFFLFRVHRLCLRLLVFFDSLKFSCVFYCLFFGCTERIYTDTVCIHICQTIRRVDALCIVLPLQHTHLNMNISNRPAGGDRRWSLISPARSYVATRHRRSVGSFLIHKFFPGRTGKTYCIPPVCFFIAFQ